MILPSLLAQAAEAAHSVAATATEHSASGNTFGIEAKYLALQFFSFSIVLLVLYKFALKPLTATMDERSHKIADGLRAAEDMKVKMAESEKKQADLLKSSQAEATAVLNEARATAKALVEKAQTEAASKADEFLKRAEANLANERAKLIAEVRAEATNLVVATVAKVLATELNDSDRSRFNAAAQRELTRSN